MSTKIGGAIRLIPARAGNTVRARLLELGLKAHPRSRGEHPVPVSTVVLTVGSSPLARGTRGYRARNAAAPRLIPARAGNT